MTLTLLTLKSHSNYEGDHKTPTDGENRPLVTDERVENEKSIWLKLKTLGKILIIQEEYIEYTKTKEQNPKDHNMY